MSWLKAKQLFKKRTCPFIIPGTLACTGRSPGCGTRDGLLRGSLVMEFWDWIWDGFLCVFGMGRGAGY
jgi:hypothetical protein